jgi:epoxyqueuosine reductase
MTTSAEIKHLAQQFGADLCGIASVERFRLAPQGFHPSDIYSGTKSVIVVATREAEGPLYANSAVTYTFATEMALQKVFNVIFRLTLALEDKGIIAMPIPTEPYEYWDAASMTGKGILSLKHAGYLSGLGVIGRNTLLVNQKFGNLIRLGAIVCNAPLESDPIANFEFCSDSCNLCVDNCPTRAINGCSVTQSKCRPNSNYTNEKGYSLYVCNNCRKVCPFRSGFETQVSIPVELKNLIRVRSFC